MWDSSSDSTEEESWEDRSDDFELPARGTRAVVDWDDEESSADTETKAAAGTSLTVTPCHGGRFVRFWVSGTVFEVTAKYAAPFRNLGKGAYGAVCCAFDTERCESVAIKKIFNAFSNTEEAKRALREVKLLRHMDHKNVLALRDVIPPAHRDAFEDVYIATEIMETDLGRILSGQVALSNINYEHFLYQLICGLKYLHSANILHRDLKPSNLLLNEHGVLKLCDFGLARTVTTSSPPLTPQVGTLWYKAPEILLHSTMYTSSIDVWSVGCILMEFMLGKTLFPGTHEDQQRRLIFELIGTPNKNADLSFLDKTAARDVLRHPCHARQPFIKLFPNVKNPLAIDLAEQMLVFDPRERITVDDALAHPFLATVRDPSNEVLCHKPFSFDCEHPPLSEEQVKNLIYEEALRFQPSFGNPLLKR